MFSQEPKKSLNLLRCGKREGVSRTGHGKDSIPGVRQTPEL